MYVVFYLCTIKNIYICLVNYCKMSLLFFSFTVDKSLIRWGLPQYQSFSCFQAHLLTSWITHYVIEHYNARRLNVFPFTPSTVASSSRWKRLPPEYGSTSEEEFGSNRNSPKHGGRSHMRPHHLTPHRSSRLSTSSPGSSVVTGPGGVVMKHRMREQEEYIKDWTAHSEEIARYWSFNRPNNFISF